MTQFRDSFYQFVPPWLSTDNGEKYMYCLELMRDLLCEKAFQAVTIRLPGQGDVSQIPFLAFDRQLVQGPRESNASFVVRLQEALPTWDEAGSAIAVLGQLQAYSQGYQTYNKTQFAIVSNPRTLESGAQFNQWWTLNYSDPIGTEPLYYLAFPTVIDMSPTYIPNFDWDGNMVATWRNWLVIFQYLDAPFASGTHATITTAIDGSFVAADWGENVGGVWMPKTSGTPLNAPFLTIHGLSGLLASSVGSILTLSGSSHSTNNGQFQIVQVINSSECVIANVDGVPGDAGPLTWEVASYPWMPPNLPWGSPGQAWGEGEDIPPPVDIGSNQQGTWKPTTLASAGELPSYSWGVRVNTLEISTVRGLVKAWKSASTYYPNIIIAYDGDNGAYSRTSTEGSGNPDGTFGDFGGNVGGVWTPTRAITSPWDCYCQGTGVAAACSVENMT